MPLNAGERLGAYKIVGLIGAGDPRSLDMTFLALRRDRPHLASRTRC
jgi:hypothetical protein